MRQILMGLLTLGLFTGLMLGNQLPANAADSNSVSIGVVDFEKVIVSYAKAKDFATKDNQKRQELKTLRDQLADQLKKGESLSPVEKKVLEDKLNAQFGDQLKAYRDWATAEDDTLRKNVDAAIEQVSKDQSVGLILIKPAVFQGGKDITDLVIQKLNK